MADSLTQRKLYLQRRSALYSERSSFIAHWMEISKYFLPRSGRFMISDRNKGDKRFNNILDNSGTRALRILAAGLMSGMTSPARPWFRLAISDRSLMEYGPVKQWLDDVTTMMRDIFNKSNTYRSLHSMYEELGVFGTSASFVLDDFQDVIRHYPMTAGEYAIAINERYEVDTHISEFEMSVAQIVKRYVKVPGGDQWGRISAAVKNLYDRGSLDSMVPVMRIIEPRADRDSTKRDAINMRYASCTMETGGNEDKFLNESGYKRFPVLAPRWFALGGDAYATACPGMEALGDNKQLQHGQLRKAQGIDYMTKPPLQAPSGTKSYEIDILPGGISTIAMPGPNTGVRTLFDVKLDLSGQLDDIRDVRERLRSTFYADLFIAVLLDEKNQPDTARAVAEKHEEKLLMIGPVLERLHNELLKPKIDITFDKMLEADIVPPPPPEMHQQELSIEFVSMLAQAQRAISTQSIDRYVMSMGTIAQFKPGVLDKFDEDRWADKYADMLGVDPDLIVSNDKVAIIRDQRAQAQAAQAKAAAMQQVAETAKTASQADTSGQNGLTDAISQFSGYTSGVPAAA